MSYPRPDQKASAEARAGWLGRLHLLSDWIIGCIAVTNPEIEELWRVVPDGTRIEIRP